MILTDIKYLISDVAQYLVIPGTSLKVYPQATVDLF